MRLYYIVAVDVDRAQLVEDRPPEAIPEAIADEIRSALDDKSARRALGLTSVAVRQTFPEEREHEDIIYTSMRRTNAENV